MYASQQRDFIDSLQEKRTFLFHCMIIFFAFFINGRHNQCGVVIMYIYTSLQRNFIDSLQKTSFSISLYGKK